MLHSTQTMPDSLCFPLSASWASLPALYHPSTERADPSPKRKLQVLSTYARTDSLSPTGTLTEGRFVLCFREASAQRTSCNKTAKGES